MRRGAKIRNGGGKLPKRLVEMLEERRLLSVPPAPTLSVDSATSSSITLSYSYDGVSDLTLEAKGPADINFHTITPTWNTTAQTVAIAGLLDETTYAFRMVAALACQQSYGTVQGTTATNDGPTGDETLAAPVIGPPQGSFWSNPPVSYTPVGFRIPDPVVQGGGVGYQLRWDDRPDFFGGPEWGIINPMMSGGAQGQVTTATDFWLGDHPGFHYSVRAYNIGGTHTSPWSEVFGGTVTGTQTSGTSNLTATATGANSVSLTWSGEQGVYYIMGGDGAGHTYQAMYPSYGVPMTIPGLAAGNWKFVVFTATSAMSNVAEVALGAPAAPAGLSATPYVDVAGLHIGVSWLNIPNNENGYLVRRRLDGQGDSDWAVVGNVAADTTIWTDNSVAYMTSYEYSVVAHNSVGVASSPAVDAPVLEINLDALEAADAQHPDNHVTATDTIAELYVLEQDSGSSLISLLPSVSIPSATVVPASALHYVLWKVSGDEANAASGDFADDVTVTLTPGAREFDIHAGVDANHNGLLDVAEINRHVHVTVVKVEFSPEPFSTYLNTRSVFGISVTPYSAASHMSLILEGTDHATFAGGASELLLSPATTQVTVYGANVNGSGSVGQAWAAVKMDTADTPYSAKKKDLDIQSLADWIGEMLSSFTGGALAGSAMDASPMDAESILSSAANTAADQIVDQVGDTLEFIADPANSDPRQAEAELALSYFNTGGRDTLKTGIKDLVEGSVNQLLTGTADNLSEWDTMNLADVGNVKASPAGGSAALSLSPVFEAQSISTLLGNLQQLGDFSTPGLFVQEMGALLTVNADLDTQIKLEFTAKWDQSEPKWRDTTLGASFGLRLLDVAGGTLNADAGITYDLGDRDFDYIIGVNWSR